MGRCGLVLGCSARLRERCHRGVLSPVQRPTVWALYRPAINEKYVRRRLAALSREAGRRTTVPAVAHWRTQACYAVLRVVPRTWPRGHARACATGGPTRCERSWLSRGEAWHVWLGARPIPRRVGQAGMCKTDESLQRVLPDLAAVIQWGLHPNLADWWRHRPAASAAELAAFFERNRSTTEFHLIETLRSLARLLEETM